MERIKLFMNYDSSKTLIENKQSLSVYDNSYVSDFLFEQIRKPIFSTTKDLESPSRVDSTVTVDLVNDPILDTLRWIRRNAWTNIGMVVDVLTAVIPYTVNINKLAWVMIVVLDIYELISNTNDPLDFERTSYPYVHLIMDLIALLFTGIVGNAMKPMLKGSSKFTSASLKTIQNLLKQLPKLKSLLKTFYSILTKVFPKLKPIFDSVLKGIDKILFNIETFIHKLTSPYGFMVAGIATAASSVPDQTLKLGSKGPQVKQINSFLIKLSKHGELNLGDKMEKYLEDANDNFTENTKKSVMSYEKTKSKNKLVKVDGEVSPDEYYLYNINN